MVQALSPPLQESGHAAGWIGWLQQFNLTILHRKQRGAHSLIDDPGPCFLGKPEDVPVKRQRLLQATHRDGDVVNSCKHRTVLADARPMKAATALGLGSPYQGAWSLSMRHGPGTAFPQMALAQRLHNPKGQGRQEEEARSNPRPDEDMHRPAAEAPQEEINRQVAANG